MGNLDITSKWRNDIDGLRARLRHRIAAIEGVVSTEELRGWVYSAEDVVRAPVINTLDWNNDAQQSFDTAVEQLVQHWIANPDWAKSSKDGAKSRSYADEVPISVKIFWANFAEGRLPGEDVFDFVVARATKRTFGGQRA